MHSDKLAAAVSAILTDLPGIRVLGVCAILLTFVLLGLGYHTGSVRSRLGVTTNPEDAHGRTVTETLPPEVTRVLRAHRNALENIMPFLFVALLAVITGAPAWATSVSLIVFTGARMAHAVFYVRAMQPWRSASYGVGQLALAAMILLLFIQICQRG